MTRQLNQNPSKFHQDYRKATSNRDNGKNRFTPARREQWAEVLATADRYF